MQSVNRAGPHVLLGAFTLLSVAALVVSLDTAPANARQQLRTAAADTAGASSFVLTDTEVAGPANSGTSASGASEEQAVIVYRAPDRVEETVTTGGRTLSVLVVGNERYERVGSGKWYDLGTGSAAGPSTGAQAVAQVLFPMQSLASATNVSVRRNVYRFVPGQPSLLLTRLLGTTLPAASTAYAAAVRGEFVRYELIVARAQGEQVTVLLTLSDVEHAPALSVPSRSQLTSVPPGP